MELRKMRCCWSWTLILLTLFWLKCSTGIDRGRKYRLCVPQEYYSQCDQMLLDTSATPPEGSRLECIPGRDKLDCLHKIYNEEADVAPFEPEEIYIAATAYRDQLVVIKEIRITAKQHEEFRYEAVSVVKNTSRIRSLGDLHKKKSCHTGYGRTTGWQVPIPNLISTGVMNQQCEPDMTYVERELASVSDFFGRSCVPGSWTPDTATDSQLKGKYRSLCELCDNPGQCEKDDKFAGYVGSLRCLTEGDGDVAWTKLEVAKQYFGLSVPASVASAPASEYRFLCPDGQSQPLTAPFPCVWAGRPWTAYLTRKSLSGQAIMDLQAQIRQVRTIGVTNPSAFRWFSEVLEFDSDYVDVDPVTPIVASKYLDKANYTLTIDKPSCDNKESVRFCVMSPAEKSKCETFRLAAFARRVRPDIGCVDGESPVDCMRKIRDGQADVVSLDAGLVYSAGKEYKLMPVLSEQYGDMDASYYAVAVVKSSSGIQTIRDLHGKKSCHTGYGRTAGWNIPVYVLREKRLVFPTDCNFAKAMGHFFSQSCVPGAKLPENDPNDDNPKNLCALCVGEDVIVPPPGGGLSSSTVPLYKGGASRCASDSTEAFSSYTGAFRCLVEGGGDVAFVKHVTVPSNTDGHNNASWSRGLRSSDFRLLCKDGGTMSVRNYASCHWGRVPAHKVMTSGSKDGREIENIRLALLRASDIFSPHQSVFRMFGPFAGQHDLLFKDSTTGLVNVLQGSSYLETLDDDYVRMVEEIKNCNGVDRLMATWRFLFAIMLLQRFFGIL